MFRLLCGMSMVLVSSLVYGQGKDLKVELSVSNKEWKIDCPLGASIAPLGDQLQIGNRCALFREGNPTKISLEWYPRNMIQESPNQDIKTDNNFRLYGDHLAIVLDSDGEMTRMKDGRGGEVSNGIIIKLDAGGGNMWIFDQRKDKEATKIQHRVLPRDKGHPTIVDDWHDLTITRVERTICVKLDEHEPLVGTLPDDTPAGKFWGLYNREPVGPGGRHVSWIRDLVVE